MAEDKNLVVIDNREIQNMIYTFRGKQVMVDSDLAELYKVTTGNLNKAMKRNSSRFPEHFCFQLTELEYKNLRFQNGTSSTNSTYGGRRYMPYVYTEQGIAMLSAVLKSEVAVDTSIKIMAGKGSLTTKDINKFNAQYPSVRIKTTTDFHDRFLIIDDKEGYFIGASIKDAGKKSFAITKIEDGNLVQDLINKVR